MADLTEQFVRNERRYSDFCERMNTLLRQLLQERGIPVHSIVARVKSRESLAKKVSSKEKSYNDVGEVTDIAGVRVITYFSDQVNQVAQLIQDEFMVDPNNSVDKGDLLDPDRFGYLSLHYVVSLGTQRAALAEYRHFHDLKAEIQVRSILQHAWAEIEHDLGYKAAREVPRSVRRQFARLAGLLELADAEFVRIRGALDNYSEEVVELIAQRPETVLVDTISLARFVQNDELARFLDKRIADVFQIYLSDDYADDRISPFVGQLTYFGIETIGAVTTALRRHREDIVDLAVMWEAQEGTEKPNPEDVMPRGVSLLYLSRVLAGATGDVEHVRKYLETFNIGDISQTTEEIAQELVQFMAARNR